MGFKVWGLGFGVWCLGFGVWSKGDTVGSLRCPTLMRNRWYPRMVAGTWGGSRPSSAMRTSGAMSEPYTKRDILSLWRLPCTCCVSSSLCLSASLFLSLYVCISFPLVCDSRKMLRQMVHVDARSLDVSGVVRNIGNTFYLGTFYISARATFCSVAPRACIRREGRAAAAAAFPPQEAGANSALQGHTAGAGAGMPSGRRLSSDEPKTKKHKTSTKMRTNVSRAPSRPRGKHPGLHPGFSITSPESHAPNPAPCAPTSYTLNPKPYILKPLTLNPKP